MRMAECCAKNDKVYLHMEQVSWATCCWVASSHTNLSLDASRNLMPINLAMLSHVMCNNAAAAFLFILLHIHSIVPWPSALYARRPPG